MRWYSCTRRSAALPVLFSAIRTAWLTARKSSEAKTKIIKINKNEAQTRIVKLIGLSVKSSAAMTIPKMAIEALVKVRRRTCNHKKRFSASSVDPSVLQRQTCRCLRTRMIPAANVTAPIKRISFCSPFLAARPTVRCQLWLTTLPSICRACLAEYASTNFCWPAWGNQNR